MGRAIYFSKTPKYTKNKSYRKSSDQAIVLLCLVLVGESQKCPKDVRKIKNTSLKNGKKALRY